jgi:hypothetical protein
MIAVSWGCSPQGVTRGDSSTHLTAAGTCRLHTCQIIKLSVNVRGSRCGERPRGGVSGSHIRTFSPMSGNVYRGRIDVPYQLL